MSIQQGDEVMVEGEWYPVIGFALMHIPNGPTAGSVFTDKPYGIFEVCLGYRIDYAKIQKIRTPA
jgi:hypothetical protein